MGAVDVLLLESQRLLGHPPAVSKVRGFFRYGHTETDVATPRVETGAEVERDPSVTPEPFEDAPEAPGGPDSSS